MALAHESVLRQPRFRLLLILLLSSALSVGLSLFRIWYSDTRHFIFLNWNLLLAWMPLALAYLLWRLDRAPNRPAPPLLLVLFASWLLFFPNAPYIVSDLIHITPRDNIPVWYDATMIFSFAWNGLIVGFVSLWLVQQVVARWGRTLFAGILGAGAAAAGAAVGWFFVAAALAATGFGVYLGRFQRWNSWDVLVDPLGMARQVLVYALNPLDHPRTLGVTLLFAAFLLIAYLTFTLLPAAMAKTLIPEQPDTPPR